MRKMRKTIAAVLVLAAATIGTTATAASAEAASRPGPPKTAVVVSGPAAPNAKGSVWM